MAVKEENEARNGKRKLMKRGPIGDRERCVMCCIEKQPWKVDPICNDDGRGFCLVIKTQCT